MKNYVSQKLTWIQYLIEAVDRVGRREIEARWESVKGLGDEEGFNRMVEYLSMRLFGDGYWWEFEAEAEKEGKQKVGEEVKIFIEKVRIFAEKLGWDESKIKRTVLLGVREEFRGWLWIWRRSLEMACQRRTGFRCKRNKGIYYQKFRCNQEGGGRSGNDTRVASTARCNQES